MSTVPENLTTHIGHATVVTSVAEAAPQPKRWTREEYYRLAEQGWFRDQRVELIGGEIIVLTPQSSQHAAVIGQVNDMLMPIFGEAYWVRTQLPLTTSAYGEPEPDISIVLGKPSDFVNAHPKTALLVVEVSFSSLDYDEKIKSHLYASMGVPDYWVLDLDNRQLLVYRQPVANCEAQFGHRYEQLETISAGGHVSPLEISSAKLAVDQMLPISSSE